MSDAEKKKETNKEFAQGSLEKLFDRTYVSGRLASGIYTDLRDYIDNNNINDPESFNLAIESAYSNWSTAREVAPGEQSPKQVSTFRTAVSTLRTALTLGVSLTDDNGDLRGKSALTAANKAKKEETPVVVTDDLHNKRYKKLQENLTTMLVDMDPATQLTYVVQLYKLCEELKNKLTGVNNAS